MDIAFELAFSSYSLFLELIIIFIKMLIKSYFLGSNFKISADINNNSISY